MKNTLITLSILGIIGFTSANYTAKVPLEQLKGGSLPNGSIIFTNQTVTAGNWTAITSDTTEWVNDGEPFNCTNWTPDPSTVALGQLFNQTATDCEQKQTRTRQDREQETTTLEIRNIGVAVQENQIISATHTREIEGTGNLISWEDFADQRSLSKVWNSTLWNNRGLTEIPTVPYPITNPTTLALYENQITNIDGLSNLTSVGTLNLAYNNLTNVDALSNLTSVGAIHLDGNQLTNIDGLSNLTNVTWDISLEENPNLTNVNGLINLTNVGRYLFIRELPLNNIDGIANIVVGSEILIDENYSGPKLAATTRFCSLNDASKFSIWHAPKSKLCQ